MKKPFDLWYENKFPDLTPGMDDFYGTLLDCWSSASKNSGEVGTILVDEVEEHPDGSATYTFTVDDSTAKQLQGFGLEFVLYCAAYGVDMQDALDLIKGKTDEND